MLEVVRFDKDSRLNSKDLQEEAVGSEVDDQLLEEEEVDSDQNIPDDDDVEEEEKEDHNLLLGMDHKKVVVVVAEVVPEESYSFLPKMEASLMVFRTQASRQDIPVECKLMVEVLEMELKQEEEATAAWHQSVH